MWQQAGFLADVFERFKRHGVSIDIVSTSETNVTVTLDPLADNLASVDPHQAMVIPPAYNRFPNSFSHIFAGGYAAGYYSYKWAEVLSADAFSKFEERGVFDRATGLEFLQNILEQGGSREPMELFVNFRGRARIDESADVRKRVYDESPEFERNQDKDRKGVALIIDLGLLERCTVDFLKRYRNHPSLLFYMAMNEEYTKEEVYRMWRGHVLGLDGTRWLIPSAYFPDDRENVGSWFKPDLPAGMTDIGASYSWAEPVQYFQWVREARNWMFMMEGGSASLPPISSLARFLPEVKAPTITKADWPTLSWPA